MQHLARHSIGRSSARGSSLLLSHTLQQQQQQHVQAAAWPASIAALTAALQRRCGGGGGRQQQQQTVLQQQQQQLPPAAAAAHRHTNSSSTSPTRLRAMQQQHPQQPNDSSSSSSSDPVHADGPESAVLPPASPRPTLGPARLQEWVVNKAPINGAMTPELYSYLLSLTEEPPVLAELREETATIHGGHMQVSPEQGRFMALLVQLLGVKTAVEVGVFTGYSSLAVALALPAGGRLYALDRDPKTLAVAQRYWDAAGVADKVVARCAPGLDSLAELLTQHGPNSFDFAFIDADKGNYTAYFEACLALVRPGGCIAVDNVLFYGRVVDPERQDRATVAIRAFNKALQADSRVAYAIVPIGDGVALCRKLP